MSVIPDEGLSRVAAVILADMSHAGVGTGTGAEATTDVQLGTETNRLAPTSTISQANQIIIRTFFSNANLPSTTTELGWFMNGSGTSNSGEFLARALNTFVKGSQDLNIVLQLTISRS
jgi:hypothetical protein